MITVEVTTPRGPRTYSGRMDGVLRLGRESDNDVVIPIFVLEPQA